MKFSIKGEKINIVRKLKPIFLVKMVSIKRIVIFFFLGVLNINIDARAFISDDDGSFSSDYFKFMFK